MPGTIGTLAADGVLRIEGRADERMTFSRVPSLLPMRIAWSAPAPHHAGGKVERSRLGRPRLRPLGSS